MAVLRTSSMTTKNNPRITTAIIKIIRITVDSMTETEIETEIKIEIILTVGIVEMKVGIKLELDHLKSREATHQPV